MNALGSSYFLWIQAFDVLLFSCSIFKYTPFSVVLLNDQDKSKLP